jgi:hypothetical protein
MKLIERCQAPIFDELNEFGEPVVTYVFGVVRVGYNLMEYLYNVATGEDEFFRVASLDFPLNLKKKNGNGFRNEKYSLERYCDGMVYFYHGILGTLQAKEQI